MQIDLQQKSSTQSDALTQTQRHQLHYAIAWVKRLKRLLLKRLPKQKWIAD